jgi:hypothetical protein
MFENEVGMICLESTMDDHVINFKKSFIYILVFYSSHLILDIKRHMLSVLVGRKKE